MSNYIMEKNFSPKLSFTITLLISFSLGVILLAILHVTPFGQRSLATMDAKIQYLDFFSYYKDVLSGKSGLFYSFTKMLGGNGIADFSYYLASPLNLLIFFFEKPDLNVFFSLLVIMKTALSCAFFSLYLSKRWLNLNSLFTTTLSIGYGFSQYTAAQSSNIMWLDGVFLLPVIMIGVFNIIDNGKSKVLILSIFINILFSWYTAYFNILFSFIYFIFEELYRNSTLKGSVKDFIKLSLSIFLGVGCGMFLFLPTIIALSAGKGGIEWWLLKYGFNGNAMNLISNYIIGGMSSRGHAALYCGSIVIPLVISFLFFIKTEKEKKVAAVFLIASMTLSLYFIPFEFVFNEFRGVNSYYYRYSYISSCSLLLVAACYLSSHKHDRQILKSSLIFSFLIMSFGLISQYRNIDDIYTTAILSIALSMLLIISNSNMKWHKWIKTTASISFFVIFIIDISVNYITVSHNIGYYSASDYKKYVEKQNNVIDGIKNLDGGIYRVVNQTPRTERYHALNPNNNEPSAYGYMGISSYSSSFNSNQVNLLRYFGYATRSDFTNTYTRIFSSDSLLSIKYVVSDEEINGLKYWRSIQGKKIYINQYFIPFGFTYKGHIDENTKLNETNPFEFQNELFSILTGQQQELFIDIKPATKIENNKIKFELNEKNIDGQIYGYINTYKNYWNNGEIYSDGEFLTAYSAYLAPRVFQVLKADKNINTTVEYSKFNNAQSVVNSNFAILDTGLLSVISKSLSEGKLDHISINKSSINIVATVDDNEHSLFLPITIDKGWKVLVNGKRININNSLGNIASIPLLKGKNDVEMTFIPPGLYFGIIVSLVSFLLILFVLFSSTTWFRKKENKKIM